MNSATLINNLATCMETLRMGPTGNEDMANVIQDAINYIKKQDKLLLKKMVG